MLRMYFFAAAMICGFVLAGCDFPEPKRPVAGGIGGLNIDDGATSGQPATPVADPPAPTPPQEVRRTAEVGASEFQKGQGYGRMSIFASNVASLYRTNERINLLMVKHNMDIYKAANDNRGPRTHEEFMREIIGPMKLPQLKEKCRYEYNPQTEELEIVHPIDMKP